MKKNITKDDQRIIKKLTKYEKYSRRNVFEIFRLLFDEKKSMDQIWKTWGAITLGKYANSLNNDFIFFVNSSGSNDKVQRITEKGVLSWVSQNQNSFRSDVIKQYIKHNDDINNIYLFYREDSKDDYYYLGELKYINHDEDKEQPVYFKFQIVDWDKTLTANLNLDLIPSNEEHKSKLTDICYRYSANTTKSTIIKETQILGIEEELVDRYFNIRDKSPNFYVSENQTIKKNLYKKIISDLILINNKTKRFSSYGINGLEYFYDKKYKRIEDNPKFKLINRFFNLKIDSNWITVESNQENKTTKRIRGEEPEYDNFSEYLRDMEQVFMICEDIEQYFKIHVIYKKLISIFSYIWSEKKEFTCNHLLNLPRDMDLSLEDTIIDIFNLSFSNPTSLGKSTLIFTPLDGQWDNLETSDKKELINDAIDRYINMLLPQLSLPPHSIAYLMNLGLVSLTERSSFVKVLEEFSVPGFHLKHDKNGTIVGSISNLLVRLPGFLPTEYIHHSPDKQSKFAGLKRNKNYQLIFKRFDQEIPHNLLFKPFNWNQGADKHIANNDKVDFTDRYNHLMNKDENHYISYLYYNNWNQHKFHNFFDDNVAFFINNSMFDVEYLSPKAKEKIFKENKNPVLDLHGVSINEVQATIDNFIKHNNKNFPFEVITGNSSDFIKILEESTKKNNLKMTPAKVLNLGSYIVQKESFDGSYDITDFSIDISKKKAALKFAIINGQLYSVYRYDGDLLYDRGGTNTNLNNSIGWIPNANHLNYYSHVLNRFYNWREEFCVRSIEPKNILSDDLASHLNDCYELMNRSESISCKINSIMESTGESDNSLAYEDIINETIKKQSFLTTLITIKRLFDNDKSFIHQSLKDNIELDSDGFEFKTDRKSSLDILEWEWNQFQDNPTTSKLFTVIRNLSNLDEKLDSILSSMYDFKISNDELNIIIKHLSIYNYSSRIKDETFSEILISVNKKLINKIEKYQSDNFKSFSPNVNSKILNKKWHKELSNPRNHLFINIAATLNILEELIQNKTYNETFHTSEKNKLKYYFIEINFELERLLKNLLYQTKLDYRVLENKHQIPDLLNELKQTTFDNIYHFDAPPGIQNNALKTIKILDESIINNLVKNITGSFITIQKLPKLKSALRNGIESGNCKIDCIMNIPDKGNYVSDIDRENEGVLLGNPMHAKHESEGVHYYVPKIANQYIVSYTENPLFKDFIRFYMEETIDFNFEGSEKVKIVNNIPDWDNNPDHLQIMNAKKITEEEKGKVRPSKLDSRIMIDVSYEEVKKNNYNCNPNFYINCYQPNFSLHQNIKKNSDNYIKLSEILTFNDDQSGYYTSIEALNTRFKIISSEALPRDKSIDEIEEYLDVGTINHTANMNVLKDQNDYLLISSKKHITGQLRPVIFNPNNDLYILKDVMAFKINKDRVNPDYLRLELFEDYFLDQIDFMMTRDENNSLNYITPPIDPQNARPSKYQQPILDLLIKLPPSEKQEKIIQKRNSALLKKASKTIEESEQKIQKIAIETIANVSHNFDNQLGRIKENHQNIIDYLEEKDMEESIVRLEEDYCIKGDDETPLVKELLYDIKSNIKDMIEQVKTTLIYSRVDAVSSKFEQKNICTLIRDEQKLLPNSFELKMPKRTIKQGVGGKEIIDDNVEEEKYLCDLADTFSGVIKNFMNNAIKHGFTDPDRKDYEIIFDITQYLDENKIKIKYSNNGKPMPKEFTFEKWSEPYKKFNSDGHGMGGAFITKIIKEIHNGTIKYIQNSEKVEFHFELPIKRGI